MLVGILSGIHGNLEGLEAVLSECDERELDEINCLGDVVGYGAPVGRLHLCGQPRLGRVRSDYDERVQPYGSQGHHLDPISASAGRPEGFEHSPVERTSR